MNLQSLIYLLATEFTVNINILTYNILTCHCKDYRLRFSFTQILIRHFELDEEAAQQEWTLFKNLPLSAELCWKDILFTVVRNYKDVFPCLHQLAAVALVVPVSTAGGLA